MKNFKLIGISGHARSGKDTFATIFNSYFKNEEQYEIKKYATKLKTICSILTGIPEYYFYNGDYRNMYLNDWDMNLRQIQQFLGTDIFRNQVSDDIWINALFKDYKENLNWIITDVRFPNEFEAIKKRNGINIKIVRDDINKNDRHISEIVLDNYNNWDYILYNNGTIENFDYEIKKIVTDIKGFKNGKKLEN